MPNEPVIDPLKVHREEIDRLDLQILSLLNQRAAQAQAIGHLKNGTIYRAEREAQILARIEQHNSGPLGSDALKRLYVEIMSACRALEKKLAVAFLGPKGTFTQQAAFKQFGHSCDAIDCASIDEIFRMVESGNADYAVVPVENSTGGMVNRTLDLLLTSTLKICAEVQLKVRQNLLANEESLANIGKVYSHEQSLAQCHEWLNNNLPQAKRIAVASNAEAARLASLEPETAAIGPETAAEVYSLKIVARSIEDEPDNTTRFLVLGKSDSGPSGRDKTSIAFSAKNEPGAMHALLTPLAQNQVSMTKLESRPAKTGLWEYVFFVDLEGHRLDAAVARALKELENKASFLKILGSYPAAN